VFAGNHEAGSSRLIPLGGHKEVTMRFYNQPHAFYAGVDLHARSMFTHVLDQAGNTVLAKDLPADPDIFLDAIAPFRAAGIVVGCECMFAWYWVADLCEDKSIPFTLGHALYMKLIHGGKSKNDRLDGGKIATLLRGGMFPMAYVYPRDKRETRDLLRRRCHFVEQRSQLLAHIVNTNSQYNLPALTMKLCYKGNRSADFAQRFKHPAVRRSIEANLKLIDTHEEEIKDIERFVLKTAKIDNPVTLQLLRTTPGIGKILSLILLYEIDNIASFPEAGNFLSYSGWCVASMSRPARRRGRAARRSATRI
jgi:transposase